MCRQYFSLFAVLQPSQVVPNHGLTCGRQGQLVAVDCVLHIFNTDYQLIQSVDAGACVLK